jgi:UDP-N-acetylglucosamine 2-epimerase (non-hydrolysing)
MPKIKREFVFVFGTRPEYERMEEIYKTFLEKKHEVRLFYIPQNQSKELENTLKNNYLKAEIFYKKERDLFSFIQITLFKNLKNNPVVFACSDTSTCLATAIFTKNFKIPLVKIDAGLRRGSFLLNEDKNSILSDHLADILFCSSEQNKTNLIKELLPEEKVFVSGTTLIKGLHIKIHEKNLYKEKNGPIIVSIHRKETLENQKNIWILLREIAKRNCLTKVILNKALIVLFYLKIRIIFEIDLI